MTTADERISSDLAVLGRASRERPIALETTLRRIGALHVADEPKAQTSTQTAFVLLTLSRIYMQRIARIGAGVATLAATIGLLLYVSIPRSSQGQYDSVLDEPFYMNVLWLAPLVLLAAVSTYVVVARASVRHFERTVRAADEPLPTARRMNQQVAGWTVVASIVGVTSFFLFFGLMVVTLGTWGALSIVEVVGNPRPTAASASLLLCAGSIVVSSAAAVVVARRRGSSSYRWWIPIGMVLGIATILVGLTYDAGPLGPTMIAGIEPSIPLRTALTVTGTVALFLVVSGAVLRRRAREDAELA